MENDEQSRKTVSKDKVRNFYLILLIAFTVVVGIVLYSSLTSINTYNDISNTAVKDLNIVAALRTETDAMQLATVRMVFNSEQGDEEVEEEAIGKLVLSNDQHWKEYQKSIEHKIEAPLVDSLDNLRKADDEARDSLIVLTNKGAKFRDVAIDHYYQRQMPACTNYQLALAALSASLNRRIAIQLNDTNRFVLTNSTIIAALLALSFGIIVLGGGILVRHHKKLSRLQAELAEERLNRQTEITRQTIAAQEKERAELGKELHDNVNQLLSAARLNLSVAQEYPGESALLIPRSMDCLQQAVEEIRCLCKALISPLSGHLNLAESLQELVYRTQPLLPDTSLMLQVNIKSEDNFSRELKLSLYRIVQELLGNVIKHAQASKVVISLSDSRESVLLEMSDNGKGFDKQKPHRGVGLDNISTRVEAFHGSLYIQTAPGRGCRYKIRLPVEVRKSRAKSALDFNYASLFSF